MKKYLLLLAAATFMFAACDPQNVDPDDPDGPDEQEYVQPIDIDGDFADWGKLDANKIATAKCNADASKTALKLVKVYADEYFIFVYFEWDKEQIAHEPDVEHVPFHVYLNGDGDAPTGGFGDQWNDACTELLLEGFIYPDGSSVGSYDPDCFQWIGDPNGSGWSWSDIILPAGSGFTKGAGVEGKYEFQIVRELYPLGKIADNFSIGFDIQQSWDSVGVLPNAAVTDDNPSGLAASLQVVTVK